MKKYFNNEMHERNPSYTTLAALWSPGLRPAVEAIRNKMPATAEALLMDIEADHSATMLEYTGEENYYIDTAIEECWKRVDQLYEEQKGS